MIFQREKVSRVKYQAPSKHQLAGVDFLMIYCIIEVNEVHTGH